MFDNSEILSNGNDWYLKDFQNELEKLYERDSYIKLDPAKNEIEQESDIICAQEFFKRKNELFDIKQSIIDRMEEPRIGNFIKESLNEPSASDLITRLEPSDCYFKIREPEEMAEIWGDIKHAEKMCYNNMARSIRFDKNNFEKFSAETLRETFPEEIKRCIFKLKN